MPRTRPLVAIVILAGTVLLACDRAPFEGEPLSNHPPETAITAGPPSLERTDFKVEFHWTGADLDGDVVGFEWRISDNGADGIVDVADTFEANLAWRFTTVTDSIFEVEADLDSFWVDVDNGVNPAQIRSWQSHTLFVRAVDDDGLHDPTPASTSFTATTLAPTVRITIPELRTTSSCISSAPVLIFGWKAIDPDGIDEVPAATRYIRLPVDKPDGFCLTRGEFEAGNYIAIDHPTWSQWRPYDPLDLKTHSVSYPQANVGDRFLFAVQARDVAGAETPTFTWDYNVRHVRISSSKIPTIRISEPLLGSQTYVGTRTSRNFDIIGGLPLHFTWEADASEYAGLIDAYRWGIDIANRDDPNDPGWAMPWGNTSAHWSSGVLSFDEGYHELFVEARDNSGSRVSVSYLLSVIPVPERQSQRQLLVVEDYPVGSDPIRAALEARWQFQLKSLLSNQLRFYSPNDFVETEDDIERTRVNFKELVKYQAVIWFLNPSNQTYFQDLFVTGGSRTNWLEIYQRRAGNLLLMGPGASINTVPKPFFGFDFPLLHGSSENWVYRAFCVELTDVVRPTIGNIIGENPERPLRDLECDALTEAVVAPEYLERYPTANGLVPTLRPSLERRRLDREWFFASEEFYNFNGTLRNVNFTVRDCQVPMFRLRTRRDVGIQAIPVSQCPPRDLGHSIIEGAPVAIASSSYSEEKPLRGSEDYLWGFHPFAFDMDDVEQALRFILGERWEMEVF
jgi:hypothetical protein